MKTPSRTSQGLMLVASPQVMRWSAGALALAVLAAGVGTALVSYAAADRLVHPPRELSTDTPAMLGIAYEPATLQTEDGLHLAAWWIPAEAGTSKGTVIFLHGYGASKASQGLAVAPFLHDAGFDVLTFDFRAHGESQGDRTTIGIDEAADVRAAIAYVLARQGDDVRIAVFGWSMGAAAALNAADTMPSQVRAVVLDSAFARLANVVTNNLAAFTGLPRYPFEPMIMHFASGMAGHGASDNEPARHASSLQRPLLVIQGSDDRISRPTDDGDRIMDSSDGWGRLWLVPDAGHVDASRADPAGYEAHVVDFITEALS